ncbi:beta-galactosidase [Bacteroidia bacterium]|nr:beta-galactosidase [Bacteroidia bacterium]
MGFSFGMNAQAPKLQKQGNATQLIVDGKPFLMLGGELHNSACSNIEYMDAIWPRMKALNMNTILAPVSWEIIEPTEGKFDFEIVDAMISGAEKSQIKLVILWFASWKNGGSIYMPSWVKKDFKRFPRAVDQQGTSIEILSTLSEESMKADAKAFAAFMKHVREVDKNHTILMIQVENETGILNTPRDFSAAANKAFNGPIPQDLSAYLSKNKNNLTPELSKVWRENGSKTTGTWEEVFGKSSVDAKDWRAMSFYTEEIFMAYHYARYIGYVAQEGKKEYNIPMYVNAWLKGPDYPWTGRFPGGGPLPQVFDLWKCAGPALDFLSPDIYLPIFKEVVENFDRLGNPMFIPETRGGDIGASRFLWGLGEHNLMGFSPFGIDRMRRIPGAPTAAVPAVDPLAETYALVDGMSELILQHQGKGTIRGILVDKENPEQTFDMGNYIVTADASSTQLLENSAAGGLIIQLGSDEYIVLGRNLNVRFAPKVPGDLPLIGVDKVYEGVFKAGKWIPGRLLNGDETHCSTFSGTGLKMPGTSIQKISLYRYK